MPTLPSMRRRSAAILALLLLVAGAHGARRMHQAVAHADHGCGASCGAHPCGLGGPGGQGRDAGDSGPHTGGTREHGDRHGRPAAPEHSGCSTCELLALGTTAMVEPTAPAARTFDRVASIEPAPVAVRGLGVIDSMRARPPPAA